MRSVVQILAALVVIIGTGLLHGAWSHRWGAPPALAALVTRLDSLPRVIGPWSSVDREVPARELAVAGAAGSLSRIYTHSTSGHAISVLLLTGLPGNIAAHTPDVCYPGAGYTLGSTSSYTRSYGAPEHSAQFSTSTAVREGTNPSVLRVYWTWHGSKGWAAPDDARWAFSGEPLLSKLYVVRETRGDGLDPKSDPSDAFLGILLPELDRLFTDPGAEPARTRPETKR